jgi:hypothetical protein
MKKEIFDELMRNGEFERMIEDRKSNEINELLNGGELSVKQIEKIIELSREVSKKEIEKRQRDLASQPGYREYILAPLIKKILAEQKRVRDPKTGRYMKAQSETAPATPELEDKPEPKKETKPFVDASKTGLNEKKVIEKALDQPETKEKKTEITDDKSSLNKPTRRITSKKTVNNSFYNTITQRGSTLKSGDSLANVAAKTLIVFQNNRNEKLKRWKSKKVSYSKQSNVSVKEQNKYSKVNTKNKEEKKSSFFSPEKLALGAALLLIPSIAQANFGELHNMVTKFSDTIKDLIKPPPEISEMPTETDIPKELPKELGKELPKELGKEPSNEEIKKFVSVRESGGNYDILAHAIPHKPGDPTNKGGDKNLPEKFKNRKLTEMKIEDVIKLQKDMHDSELFPSTAIGKYQFIQGTLEYYVKKLKLDPKTTNFSEKIQEMLMDKLIEDEIETVKKSGLPVTLKNIYAVHFLGPGNFLKAAAAKPDKTYEEIFGEYSDIITHNPSVKGTIPKLDRSVTPSTAGVNKEEPSTPPKSTSGVNLEKESRPIIDNIKKNKVVTIIKKINNNFTTARGGVSVIQDDTQEPKPAITQN